ncbi:TldD/PmbA family protein [bacterium]|nr:TldD/PmbA family protein [bacterium]
MIDPDLSHFKDVFTEYTELRQQVNQSRLITLVNGNLTRNNQIVKQGVSARVYRKGSWGFASAPGLSDRDSRLVIETATRNARFLDIRQNKAKEDLPSLRVQQCSDKAFEGQIVPQSELIDFLHTIDRYLVGNCPALSARTLIMSCHLDQRSMLNSDGTQSWSLLPRAYCYLFLSLERDGKPVELLDIQGGTGFFPAVFPNEDSLFRAIDTQYRRLLEKAEGVYAEAGQATCVLSPQMSGILAHEAIGHTTEADHILGGSIAAEYLNQQIASPLVTLIDYAQTAFGQPCQVPIRIDDEGTPATDAVIIDQGVLRGYLHNKESARHFGVRPTGNARASSFADEPIIRMRNTAFSPGQACFDEMIDSIEQGYYLIQPGEGQADSNSEFTFGVHFGYEIKKGVIGRALCDTSISGIAFDVLKTVTMVSNETGWSASGMCGKKQAIAVSMGGPYLKCTLNVGGS